MSKVRKNKRKSVFDKFDGRCGYTGLILPDNWEVEHMIPINHSIWKKSNHEQVKLGCWVDSPNDINNLMPTFHQINIIKSNRTIEEFRVYLKHIHNKVLERTLSNKNIYPVHFVLIEVAFLFGITPHTPFSGEFYFEKFSSQKK